MKKYVLVSVLFFMVGFAGLAKANPCTTTESLVFKATATLSEFQLWGIGIEQINTILHETIFDSWSSPGIGLALQSAMEGITIAAATEWVPEESRMKMYGASNDLARASGTALLCHVQG